MTRYAEIADAIRERIQAGEFPVGARLPGISTLQKEYDVSGLNTIRSAQQLLVEEGLLRTQQGVGAFVVAIHPPTRPADLLALLEKARDDLTTVITALRDQAVNES
ncbi:MAG: GntR family transcriptional regulator [Actinomycetota bacterium]|nr:GntR family transcriptional regulator [Actinomycetota bacterium]